MQKTLIRHVELLASISALLTTLIAPNLLRLLGLDWTATWLITLALNVLILGRMLVVVYERRLVVRRRTINQVRQMLHDRIRNHLATVWLNVQISAPDQKRLTRIRDSVEAIEQELNTLSEDTLARWQVNYETLYDELIATRPPDNNAA
jgi:hypothetical protein